MKIAKNRVESLKVILFDDAKNLIPKDLMSFNLRVLGSGFEPIF